MASGFWDLIFSSLYRFMQAGRRNQTLETIEYREKLDGIGAPDLWEFRFRCNTSHHRCCLATTAAMVAFGVVDTTEMCNQLRQAQRRKSLRERCRHVPPSSPTCVDHVPSSSETIIFAVLLVGLSVLRSHVTVEQLTKYVLYCEWLIYATWRMTNSLTSLLQSIGASEQIFQLINLLPSDQFLAKGKLAGHIQFANVSFYYPARTMVVVRKQSEAHKSNNWQWESARREKDYIVGVCGKQLY
ncbi:hypothetical protein V8G54_021286 [Vigna mungo]|uniref:Uncharacterized protein n=1 Tax=Vigna mungo TaxID=3915 RepID=A0AAQ3NDR2_VIGMU